MPHPIQYPDAESLKHLNARAIGDLVNQGYNDLVSRSSGSEISKCTLKNALVRRDWLAASFLSVYLYNFTSTPHLIAALQVVLADSNFR